MSDLRRSYPGYRLVDLRRGDTLRKVSSRELGDPERWWELASINALVPPYLTDDPSEAMPGVLFTGGRLSVPSSVDYVPAYYSPEEVFGSDLRLSSGLLDAADGDLVVTAGTANLSQAVRHAVATDLGGLESHPQYGNGCWALIGQQAGPATLLMADGFVRRCVNRDARIASITASSTSLDGDTVSAELTAKAINGVSVRVST